MIDKDYDVNLLISIHFYHYIINMKLVIKKFIFQYSSFLLYGILLDYPSPSLNRFPDLTVRKYT